MEKFIHIECCDSTQDLLKEQLSLPGPDELTVSCEHQKSGHGRGSNLWEDSPGTICLSMTVKPHQRVTFTSLEISLLIQHFFSLKGKDIKVKWPNDLISADGKKCGGILIQNYGPHFMAGIGVNLFKTNSHYGGIYETSFPIEKKNWARELSSYIRNNRYNSTEKLITDWINCCSHLNQEVRISEGEQQTAGVFIGLGPYGEAVLENSQGTHHLFNGSLRLI